MTREGDRRAFKVRGMDCAEEVGVLKRELGPLVGGEDRLGFDLLRAKMTVQAPAGQVPDAAILQAVARTGMHAQTWREVPQGTDTGGVWQRRGRTMMTAASGLAALAGFAVHAALAGGPAEALGSEAAGDAHAVPLAAKALYAVAILTGAWYVLPKAWPCAASAPT